MAPKNKDYDKQIFRLFSILNQLDSGNKVSSSDLAAQHNVTVRTVQRDIELLNSTGFLLTSPAKGLHAFEEGFTLKKARLTSEEASLLSFLYEIAKSLGTGFEKSCSDIIKKVIQQEYESPFYAKLPQGPGLKADNPFLKTLEDAICDQKKIQISYEVAGQKKEYRLCPLKIIFYEGFWYVLAQVERKKGVCKFRLERIQNAETLRESFEPADNLQTMLNDSVNIWFNEGKLEKVTLRIDKEVAHYFKQRVYFPKQRIVKENKDGSVLLETSITDKREVIPTIMHWLPHITVQHPPSIKAEVRQMVAEYSRKLK